MLTIVCVIMYYMLYANSCTMSSASGVQVPVLLLPAVWPWASYSASLSLSFLIHRMGTILAPTLMAPLGGLSEMCDAQGVLVTLHNRWAGAQ